MKRRRLPNSATLTDFKTEITNKFTLISEYGINCKDKDESKQNKQEALHLNKVRPLCIVTGTYNSTLGANF